MKKIYITPQIELIVLDNEISLALESTPPEGPGEGPMIIQQLHVNHPFDGDCLV